MGNFKDACRLAKDPEFKFLQDGKAVCNFTVAIDRPFKNGEGEKDADFHPVEVWGKLAEICANNLTKGRLILLDGDVRNNNYERDGVKHYGYKIVAESVRFLDYKKNEEAGEPPQEQPQKGKQKGGAGKQK